MNKERLIVGKRSLIFTGLLVLVTLTNGCANMILGSGKYGNVLRKGTNRELIVERLGKPIRCGTDENGQNYDVFRANGKIAWDREGMAEGEVCEILFLPLEPVYISEAIIVLPFQIIGKKDVYVYYDPGGGYSSHQIHHAKLK